MSISIMAERPDSPDAMQLVTELETHLESFYPPESRHGFSVERLIAEGVPFFLLRVDAEPAACGGIKLISDPPGEEYGELKRMYVRPQFRGRGYGRQILDHLTDYSLAQGVTLLRLETGVHQTSAIRLYEQAGFRRIPPFGPYTSDPLSLCYELRLAQR